LFWFQKNIAIVSDLHLEKGSSYAATGQLIPPFDSEETLNKLINSLKKNNVNKIILLGDTFHDEDALKRIDSNSKGLLQYIIDNYDVVFILGNHEKKMKLEKITFYYDYVIDDIHFIHEAKQNSQHQISGHFHPVATVKVGRKKITEKCLLQSNNYLILPSFGTYTGGLNINSNVIKPYLYNDSNIFLLGKKSVFRFTLSDLDL